MMRDRKGHLGVIRRPRDKRFGSSAYENLKKRTAQRTKKKARQVAGLSVSD
jgi:hypothetical protein